MIARRKVLIVGGGLAGLAAASALARRGFQVELLESRPRLGGRASSFVDQVTGDVIDNCQHVTMNCCTNFAHFASELAFDDCLETVSELLFVGPPRQSAKSNIESETATKTCPVRFARFSSSALPAPAHLALALLRQSWLSFKEKFQIAKAMRKLARTRTTDDEPFLDWLIRHKQSKNARDNFWHVVLVSALSETLDRVSLQLAKKVFVDGFLSNRSAWEVSIPKVPLDEIYETRIATELHKLGAKIKTSTGVETILVEENSAVGVQLRDGSKIDADFVVCTVPHNLVSRLIPSMANEPTIRQASKLEFAPIASVHLWYDAELTSVPHAVFVDRLSQWMFNRSHTDGNRKPVWYYQVVISAARELQTLTESEVLDQVERELFDFVDDWETQLASLRNDPFAARRVRRLHGRLITEHKAVFAPVAGVESLRADQSTSVPNLFLAGDWTKTGWPSTMEGAVRSGYLAGEQVLRAAGSPEVLIQPNLPSGWLFRLFY